MTLISFAQNGEDIVLQRALADVEIGFYIDIGAFDPIDDSVTKFFYDKGWYGVNIEPVPDFYNKFISERPRDINFNIAIGSTSGIYELSVVDGTGLSTFNEEFAQRHENAGYEIRKIMVPSITGNDLLSRFEGREIHFLKVDVEGYEKDVFVSIDFKKYRPWIILAEATEPNSQVRSDSDWASILTTNGYKFAYFDGLNSFFLADEHLERMAELAKPPNVFDNFITYSLKKLQDNISEDRSMKIDLQSIISEKILHIEALRAEVSTYRDQNNQLLIQVAELSANLQHSNSKIDALKVVNQSLSMEIVNMKISISEINQ